MDYLIKLHNIDKELSSTKFHTYFFEKKQDKKKQAFSLFLYLLVYAIFFTSFHEFAKYIAVKETIIIDIACLVLAYTLNILAFIVLYIIGTDFFNLKIFEYFESRKKNESIVGTFSSFITFIFVFQMFFYTINDYLNFKSKTQSIDELKKEKDSILKEFNENEEIVVQLIKKNRTDEEEQIYQKYIKPLLIKDTEKEEEELLKLSKEEINFIQKFKNKKSNLIIND